MSGVATLSIGASKYVKASFAKYAAISAPKPTVIQSSCAIKHLPVFLIDIRTVSLSHGAIVRKSIISNEISASNCEASFTLCTISPQVITVAWVPV